MSKKALILVGCLFSSIVLGMFIFAYVYSGETKPSAITPINNQPSDLAAPENIIVSELVLSQEFLLNTHYISGAVPVPLGCYTFNQSYLVAESYPEQVTLSVQVEDSSVDCSSPIAELPLAYEIAASEQATFTFKINEEFVPLTLIYE